MFKNRKFQSCVSGWGQQGLTLLEIMVAIFIFSIAMTTIFGSFNAVIGDVDSIEKRTKAYSMGKTCMDRIMSDLGSLHVALPPIYEEPEFDDEPDRYGFFGETVSGGDDGFSKVRFTADAHLPFEGDTRTGIAQIVYYVQQRDDDQYVLRRSDTLYPFEPVEENEIDPVLCENLRAFKLRYFDRDGEEYDTWDSDSEDFGFATPGAVGISVVIGDESDETPFETMITLPVYREKKES
jgi:general secretion pathway protein J